MAERRQGQRRPAARVPLERVPSRVPIQVPLNRRPSKAVALVHGVQQVGRTYRMLADPMKPTIDRLVDPVAVVVGGNAALSLGLYIVGNGLGSMMGGDVFAAPGALNAVAEVLVKGVTYPAVYLVGNRAAILPLARHVRHRHTTPSWPNHAKTLSAVAGMLLLSHGLSEYTMAQPGFFPKIDHVLSGQLVVDSAIGPVYGLANLVDYNLSSLSFPPRPAEVEPEPPQPEPQESLASLSQKAPDALSYGQVSNDIGQIQSIGIPITLEQLVYLARTVYWEAANDAPTPRALRKGMQGVASVIHNRWRYDNLYEERSRTGEDSLGERPFSYQDGNSHYHIIVKHGGDTWQFTCVRDRPRYYYPEYTEDPRESEGQPMLDGDNVHIAVGDMDKYQAQLAYQAVVDVLLGRVPDPTGKALFYMNPDYADPVNRDGWGRNDGKKKSVEINSHVFYTVDGEDRDKWTMSLL
ncbi:cell wall hydrolase [Candidatus Woesearchaeota archaeon]|nr:cell wall hydrolase [Candidatus Woesearchaeota archaeon]